MVMDMKTMRTKTLAEIDDEFQREFEVWEFEWEQRKKRSIVKKYARAEGVIHRTCDSRQTRGLEFILSDATPDRYSDVILPSAWMLENFLRNPVALFQHQSSFTIGTWSDVRVEGNALR